MEKYKPNALGNRSLEIIKSYLPDARIYWSSQAGHWAVVNPRATTRVFHIEMVPKELKLADIAFYICHLSFGTLNYNAVKRELLHGESQRQARARESAEGGKELQREVAHG